MKRTYLTLIILMLVVGFAAVTTNLVINGNINIGFNKDEFNVYFSYASIDYEEKQDIISEDKKSIKFETKKLTDAGSNTILTYDVTNESKQYNAKVKVTCDEGTDLYSIENSLKEETIEARSTKTGHIKVTLNDVVTEEQDIKFECHLEVTAVSRSEEKTNEIPEMCHYLNESYPVGYEWNFEYTGEEKTLTIPCNGTYKLEVWGAQGGINPILLESKYNGGVGAYSTGEIVLNTIQKLYINVGGQGEYGSNFGTKDTPIIYSGGYNGGGNGGSVSSRIAYGGGGATHIALSSGLLSTLEQKIDQILIVAGGGGGNGWADDSHSTFGGNGGGIKGTNGVNAVGNSIGYYGTGGTQKEAGYDMSFRTQLKSQGVFGRGGNNSDDSTDSLVVSEGAGGGGGYYGGGGSSRWHAGGGGGSGYIGNSLLTDKGMWCYQCETSEDEDTKTTSTENSSAEAISEYAKQGNGYAKITLVSLEN